MNKIFITRPLPPEVLKKAQTLGEVTARSLTSPLTTKEMTEALQNFDIILPTLGDLFSESIFQKVTKIRCKLLANFGVGYNHIAVEAAKENGVIVTNTPGAVTDATADVALTLMLMTARRAGEGERLVRKGKWEGWHPTQMLGYHVSGKTAAIIGMGRIGQAIAHRCHFGFGMDIIYNSRSSKNLDFPTTYFQNIEEATKKADVVFIAVPGGKATRHLINRRIFSTMKSHSILVNISRGDVIAEIDLIEALKNGDIGGAGLDVYEFEPKIPAGLLEMDNVTLFPHLGTASLEVRTEMGMMALANIANFLKGKSPPNLV